jgi:hypothetical protein
MRRALPTSISIALLAGGLIACGPDPDEIDAQAYVDAVGRLMVRDGALAAEQEELVGKLARSAAGEGGVDGAEVARVWATRLRPEADALASEARRLTPGNPALSDAHARLVKAWSERAVAYGEIADAWTRGDEAAFDAGRSHGLRARLEEEAYFPEANAVVGAWGLSLRQYP